MSFERVFSYVAIAGILAASFYNMIRIHRSGEARDAGGGDWSCLVKWWLGVSRRTAISISMLAGCVQTAAAVDETTYSDLTEKGRPSQFYEYGSPSNQRDKQACLAILEALNKSRPLKTYDLKPVLMGSSLAIDWREETVSQERRRMPGEVKTATIHLPIMRSPVELLLWTVDVRDAPVDTLILFRSPAISRLRLDDGRIDAGALLPILAHPEASSEVLAPQPEWVRWHNDHTGGNGGTPFSADYYWSEPVIVNDQLYVMVASPPQFDNQERLVGFLDIFVAPVGEHRTDELACHFVHRP